MPVMRPPVTGDAQLDSWMNQVTKEVGSATSVATAAAASVSSAGLATSVNSATLVLYKRYSSDVFPFSEDIFVDTTYNYPNTTLTNNSTGSTTNFSGWTRELPHINNGIFLFAIQVNIADTGDNAIIPYSDWSDPILLQAEGMNSATVTLYQRTATTTPPANPAGDLVYSFVTNTYTRTDTDSWTTFNNVDPNAGPYLWYAIITIASRDYTATVPSSSWKVNLGAANGAQGEQGIQGPQGPIGSTGPTGDPGGQYAVNRLWLDAAVLPENPTPIASINWASGIITIAQSSIDQGWSLLAPEISPTGQTTAYYSDIVFHDPTGTATDTNGLAKTPQRLINFDGIVSFTNVNNGIANDITYIDGGTITTVTLHADTIDANSLTTKTLAIVGTQGYLTEMEFAAGVLLYPSAGKVLPSDSAFSTRFGRAPIVNDVLYVKDTSSPFDYTTYIRRVADGTHPTDWWELFVVYVNGNVLVEGTVVADSFQAGITSGVGKTEITKDGMTVYAWNGSQYIPRVKLGKL